MRILADEDVSRSVVEALRANGHDVAWVRDVARGSDDFAVLRLANSLRRVLLTQDKGFSDLIFRDRIPAGPGVILVRWPNRAANAGIAAATVAALRKADVKEGLFSLVVIAPERLRIARLRPQER